VHPDLLEQALNMERVALTGRHSRFDRVEFVASWDELIRHADKFPSSKTTVGEAERSPGTDVPGSAGWSMHSSACGERIRVSGDGEKGGRKVSPMPAAAQRDRPRMDQVLAWKRGEAIFDNVPLTEVLAKMNRYSATPIVSEATGLAGLRISGVIKTGDNLSFAHAVASLHALAVRESSNRLEHLPN
jgi:transmembrane sensor